MKKLVLGTVQFGVDYGVSNTQGRVDPSEVASILKYAQSRGLETLDTAEAYGNAIDVLSEQLKDLPSDFFRVYSKFSGVDDVKSGLSATLEKLNLRFLEGYYYHQPSEFLKQKNHSQLEKLAREGLIKKIGASVYTLEELKRAVEDDLISLIQLPFNIFDSSEQKQLLLKEAKSKGKEIHARSVFLQGLFFMNPESLTGNLLEAKEDLRFLRSEVEKLKKSMAAVALSFVVSNELIDKVLLGVISQKQLRLNLEGLLDESSCREVLSSLSSLQLKNEDLLNPGNWRL